MSHSAEIDRYAKDPSLLMDLCREVIERLDAGDDNAEASAMEAQLREIARAIEKLDKQGVPVPDALRAEKTRLAATLGVCAEATQILNHLADEMEQLLNDLNAKIGRHTATPPKKKTRTRSSQSPKTPTKILRTLIIEALRHFGGSATRNDILKHMEEKLDGKLTPGDLEWREGSYKNAWRNNACWERVSMIRDGILKTGSPNGIWELNEDHR